MKRIALILLGLVPFASCVRRGTVAVEPQYRQFTVPSPPTVCTGEEANVYVLDHYWENFLSTGGVTDTSAIRGVRTDELRQAIANYIGMLDSVPMDRAQGAIATFFEKTQAAHAADTSSHLIPLFTDIVCDYFYDPNSPLRNEDYYLPFVSGLADSPYTLEAARPGYIFQKRMCSINRYGEQVPDFKFRTIDGRTLSLYGINAVYTMLFFSNPGCNSCQEIISQVRSRPYMDDLIEKRVVAVANIYIDEDLKAWREYEHNYPRNWYSGYDYRMILRNDSIYYIRAIPSLYLLDADKRVIMKDAPTEKVLSLIDRTAQQYGY